MLNICMRVNGIMWHDKKQRKNADEVNFKSSLKRCSVLGYSLNDRKDCSTEGLLKKHCQLGDTLLSNRSFILFLLSTSLVFV